MTTRSAVLALLLVLVSQASTALDAAYSGAPRATVPLSYFGLHIHDAGTSTSWPGVPFGAWRLWDASVTWPQLEPRRGEWDFHRLDRLLDLARTGRVEVLLPLGLSPHWASARPDEPSAYGPGNAAEPRSIEDWQRYVTKVVSRYRGRVAGYEIWNEPNLGNFFSGYPEDMLRLAREAHAIIRHLDPGAIVVSPSATGVPGGTAWLDRYLALGGAQYADVSGFHFYVSPAAPEAVLPIIASVRKIMTRHEVSRPLWSTEAGWVIENREQKADPTSVGFSADIEPVPSALAAAYTARFLILAWAAGVERNYWYAWDNKAMGLIEPRSRSPKPAAQAYAMTVGWLSGTAVESCDTGNDGVWICTIVRPGGGVARIVWRPTGNLRWALPSAWNTVYAAGLDGAEVPLARPAFVDIGPRPVLLATAGFHR